MVGKAKEARRNDNSSFRARADRQNLSRRALRDQRRNFAAILSSFGRTRSPKLLLQPRRTLATSIIETPREDGHSMGVHHFGSIRSRCRRGMCRFDIDCRA